MSSDERLREALKSFAGHGTWCACVDISPDSEDIPKLARALAQPAQQAAPAERLRYNYVTGKKEFLAEPATPKQEGDAVGNGEIANPPLAKTALAASVLRIKDLERAYDLLEMETEHTVHRMASALIAKAAPGTAQLSEGQVIAALNATTYEPGDFAPECGSHSSTWVKRFTVALRQAAPASAEGGATLNEEHPTLRGKHEAGDAHPRETLAGLIDAYSAMHNSGTKAIAFPLLLEDLRNVTALRADAPASSAPSGQQGTSAPVEAGLREALEYISHICEHYAIPGPGDLNGQFFWKELKVARMVAATALASAPSASGKEQEQLATDCKDSLMGALTGDSGEWYARSDTADIEKTIFTIVEYYIKRAAQPESAGRGTK